MDTDAGTPVNPDPKSGSEYGSTTLKKTHSIKLYTNGLIQKRFVACMGSGPCLTEETTGIGGWGVGGGRTAMTMASG